VNTVHLTDAELELARHAVHAYLTAFGHDEADTLARIRSVLAKLEAAEADPLPNVSA
jgi:multisubunit Na+/H+ antiporter MnhC subunit